MLENFPFPTLRENQEKVLLQIELAFKEGKDFVICEAPTGCGKSPIAISVGLSEGSSHILTSTKNLLLYTTDISTADTITMTLTPKLINRTTLNGFKCAWVGITALRSRKI